MAARSGAPTPSRSIVPVIDPADVPTTMSAERGSHPVDSCRADRTPAWYACPTTPPAPSTSPTSVMLSSPHSLVPDGPSPGRRRRYRPRPKST